MVWILSYQLDQVLGNYESKFIQKSLSIFISFDFISNKASRSKNAVVLNDMHKAMPSLSHMYKFCLLKKVK